MRLHYFQHESFECPYIIEDWAKENDIVTSSTHLYKEAAFPNMNEIDWLVIMGGSMSVNDTHLTWLNEEKEFIRQAIHTEKKVLGICLGAQLIANVLGANVYPNKEKEIGWFPVQWTTKGKTFPCLSHLPEEMEVLHWHGETFDLPENCIRIAESKACLNQGFIFDKRVIGLQFHMEFTEAGLESMVKACGSDLQNGTYIQTSEAILAGRQKTNSSNLALTKILDALL